MSLKNPFLLFLTFLLLISCSPQANIPVETATSLPPTATPVPTNTPEPTATPEPTNTPEPTATPGPIFIQDDFSSQSDIWGKCEYCKWKDGALFFGPYPPKEGNVAAQVFFVICESCGLHKYYRVSADVTYFEGYGADRTFGILAGITNNRFLGAGTITTNMHVLYETYDFNTDQWGGTPFAKYNAVKPGRATNHIEVSIVPSSLEGTADIIVSINGQKTITYPNQSAELSYAGLYLGWHSVGIIFDNFEYEEIVP